MAGRAHKLSKGAIAGIVIGCCEYNPDTLLRSCLPRMLVLLFLLFLILCMCCYRRRRTRTQVKLDNKAREAGFSTTPMKEVTSSPLLSQHTHSGSMVHSSPVVAAGAPYFSDRAVSRDPQVLRNLPPEASRETIETLPNPYDGDTPPQPPPRDDLSATSPTSPVSRHTSSSWYGDSTHSSNRRSTAPSAWTHDESGVPLLSRGTTHTSHRTTSSSLHDELSGYQKALEAHHRKESEDAAIREERIGEGSGIPADPPPLYTASEGA